ncbi:Cobyric acid synthase [Candidatus Lokiarchaeum ossiferum]|uniref:Probable cobyric acid synthase n=1 Tax=Candidatus Lokiarchaeum ossiferum TaxID=2951803 RepID=A0ABY6I198_9ARCH|nr:Cobyric acid synthase [Candidatus Lokiarchaeum sp. B-35]
MTAKFLMIQGTTSDSGKTTLVMALCRIFADMGYKVAPFKSQNMSLNSFVNKEGFEIARSQVLQAQAARIEPQPAHNPVLLKPKGNNTSQIILMGKPFADYKVREYYPIYIPKLIPHIKKSLEKLSQTNDVVIIEGAGSPAEINLADHEIANMFVAKLVKSPVVIVGDIDKGGVFASIYGTVELVKEDEKPLIKAYIVNKFRGDESLLTSGLVMLSEKLNMPCLGVLPYINDLYLPAEDSLDIKETRKLRNINIGVIRLPKISNFTDFEPFLAENDVSLEYCIKPHQLKNKDLIIIPGTKNTISDLNWMKENGFFDEVSLLEKQGAIILGICGGFQMLGQKIIDKGIEENLIKEYNGLGLLPTTAEFKDYDKITHQISAKVINIPNLEGQIIKGYEIHMGIIKNGPNLKTFLEYEDKNLLKKNYSLGIYNESMSTFGTFLHGIWENDLFRKEFLSFVASHHNKQFVETKTSHNEIVEQNIDKVATIVRKHLDLQELCKIVGLEMGNKEK